MAYLFWAFAAVWVGLFLYLNGLMRRSRALERQMAELLERPPAPAPESNPTRSTPPGAPRSRAGS